MELIMKWYDNSEGMHCSVKVTSRQLDNKDNKMKGRETQNRKEKQKKTKPKKKTKRESCQLAEWWLRLKGARRYISGRAEGYGDIHVDDVASAASTPSSPYTSFLPPAGNYADRSA